MSERLVLIGIVLVALSGLIGLPMSRNSNWGQSISTLLALLGSMMGLGGVSHYWLKGPGQPVSSSEILGQLGLPGLAFDFHVSIDGLSAVFLVPIFLISLLGNIYGLGHWKQTEHPETGRKLRLFYGMLTAGMALLVVARHSMLFLAGWEIMALSAFFLVTTEDQDQEVRASGWIYLVASHVATLCLFALFALLRAGSGTFDLSSGMIGSLTPGITTAIFVLALVGFGLKAGMMPLHVWLPGAHANAPSHVSAIMSGVLIKMGVYGFIRITSLFPHPPVTWGGIVLILGTVSGVLGVAFALGQHDLKRFLAYHSIENIGIIFMGIGLALLGRSLERPEWILLGLTGALLHVWNHALFKSLLFFGAGSVVHTVHTREIDHLGGLAKKMPWTALGFLIGAVAICGLPPLNGFVSEFFIYLGLFGTLKDGGGPFLAGAALAAPALALMGTLAAACFVKVYGVVFLGTARSNLCEHAQESPPSMLGPMAVLSACCFLIGLAPLLFVPFIIQGTDAWAPTLLLLSLHFLDLAPLQWITVLGLALIAASVLVGMALRVRLRHSLVEKRSTWGCGYVAPSPRMQYTASSFGQMLVALFAWALRPSVHNPGPLPLFPQKAEFHSVVQDAALDRVLLPAFQTGAWLFSCFRVLQRGSIQAYLLYIFIALLALLMWR